MLLDQEIPSGRKALIDSHNNLQKVASYCAQKYIDVSYCSCVRQSFSTAKPRL